MVVGTEVEIPNLGAGTYAPVEIDGNWLMTIWPMMPRTVNAEHHGAAARALAEQVPVTSLAVRGSQLVQNATVNVRLDKELARVVEGELRLEGL